MFTNLESGEVVTCLYIPNYQIGNTNNRVYLAAQSTLSSGDGILYTDSDSTSGNEKYLKVMAKTNREPLNPLGLSNLRYIGVITTTSTQNRKYLTMMSDASTVPKGEYYWQYSSITGTGIYTDYGYRPTFYSTLNVNSLGVPINTFYYTDGECTEYAGTLSTYKTVTIDSVNQYIYFYLGSTKYYVHYGTVCAYCSLSTNIEYPSGCISYNGELATIWETAEKDIYVSDSGLTDLPCTTYNYSTRLCVCELKNGHKKLSSPNTSINYCEWDAINTTKIYFSRYDADSQTTYDFSFNSVNATKAHIVLQTSY